MKNYSYLLLIPVLLSGCSQEESPTPQSSPPSAETNQTAPVIPNNEPEPLTPTTESTPPEISSQTLSTETIYYLRECALLLEEFDVIYRNMEEWYSLAQAQREESTYLDNYLSEIKKLTRLLEQTQDLLPTDQVQAQHDAFVASSLALAEFYQQCSAQLESSELATEEQWLLLDTIFSDLLPIFDNFSNSAFDLMVGLGQDNLAG